MTPDQPGTEPQDSTVDDWLGQEVDKDQKVADEAMAEAGGDEAKAEKIFNERSHANDPEAVPEVPEHERNQNT
jgi:hypothetical protein